MDGRAEMADFGLSAFKQATCTNGTGAVGTLAWSSREALRGQPLRVAYDVHSFGVTFSQEMFRGEAWK